MPSPRRNVLHVFGRMNRGGAETWMVHVARFIDRASIRLDFLVHSAEPGAYDDELRAMGCGIVHCPIAPRSTYAKRLLRVLREHGPYDAVHSHVHHFSGWVLAVSALAGVRVRIAHSHLDTRFGEKRGRARQVYERAMERLIARAATDGLACSEEAAAALFGAGWREDPRWRVLYCATDLRGYREPVEPVEVRRALGLHPDDFVLGHVGRFDVQKNHRFLLDVAAEALGREPRARLLLVGDGPLREEMQDRARQLGILERTRFVGARGDVPRLLRGAVDVFLFPSLFEGLGLALVEAQAAGLPAVVSDRVPTAATVSCAQVVVLPLESGARRWADAVLATRAQPRGGEEALARVLRSPFSLPAGVAALEQCYRSEPRA